MLKTPNEIKRGLETCARDEDYRGCPYYTEVYGASCITHWMPYPEAPKEDEEDE